MPSAVDDERVRRFLHQSAGELLRNADVAAAIAQVLDVLTENKRHHALLDASLNALDDLLAKEDTRRFIAVEVGKSAPLLKKISDWFQLQLDERARSRSPSSRWARFTKYARTRGTSCAGASTSVAEFIARLKADDALRAKVHAIRDELLQSPALGSYIGGLWAQFRTWLAEDSRCAPSVAHERIA